MQRLHLPAVFTTLSSKLKEPEEFPEVKGSREESKRLKCKLKRQYAGTQHPFKSQRGGQGPETQYRGTGWGKVWKNQRTAGWEAELFASGIAGLRGPLVTQATMLLAFRAGMQLVNDTKWLYRTFQSLLLGHSLHL